MMAWYWHAHGAGPGLWLWISWMVLFWGALLAGVVYFIWPDGRTTCAKQAGCPPFCPVFTPAAGPGYRRSG
jgi:hypothetical protein